MKRRPKIEPDGTTRVDGAQPYGVVEPECGCSQVQPVTVLNVPAASAPVFRSSAPTTAAAAQETWGLCFPDTRPGDLRRLPKDLGSLTVPQRRASQQKNTTGIDRGHACGDEARESSRVAPTYHSSSPMDALTSTQIVLERAGVLNESSLASVVARSLARPTDSFAPDRRAPTMRLTRRGAGTVISGRGEMKGVRMVVSGRERRVDAAFDLTLRLGLSSARLEQLSIRYFPLSVSDLLFGPRVASEIQTLEFTLGGHSTEVQYNAATGFTFGVVHGVLSTAVVDPTKSSPDACTGPPALTRPASVQFELAVDPATVKDLGPFGLRTVSVKLKMKMDSSSARAFKSLARLGLNPVQAASGTTRFDTMLFGSLTRQAKVFRLQPIFLKDRENDPKPTGLGFRFGRPALVSTWRKVGIEFDILDPIYIVGPKYKRVFVKNAGGDFVTEATLDTWGGVNGLGQLVPFRADASAIRLFFVSELLREGDMEPSDRNDFPFGGGVTMNGGKAFAFVVSSDEVVPTGAELNRSLVERAPWKISYHHLAHEVGHAIGFNHPGVEEEESQRRGSGGSIMCPSGELSDNPDRNSKYHHTVVPGPHTLRFGGSWSPDCDGTPVPGDLARSDCGVCTDGQ